jgi:acyl carrier protein
MDESNLHSPRLTGREDCELQDPMGNLDTILKNIRPEFDFTGVDDFFARGMLDSFDLTLLVSALEEKYAIAIEGTDIVPENFRSVEAIRALLTKYGAVS